MCISTFFRPYLQVSSVLFVVPSFEFRPRTDPLILRRRGSGPFVDYLGSLILILVPDTRLSWILKLLSHAMVRALFLCNIWSALLIRQTTSVHTQPPLPASEGFPAGGSTDSKGMAIPMSFPGGHTPARVPQDVEASSSAPAPSKDAPLTFTFASIRRVEPTPHINTPGLRAKVSFMTSIETPDEETMVRSLHPSLASYEQVSVVEHGPVATPLWLISASSAKNIKSTHAAGREIHVLPKQLIPPVSFQMVPTRYTTIKTIDPRTFLPPEHIKSIRDAFPGSVGAQVLLTGFLLVVFPDKKSLEACWAKGAPDEVGNLRVGYILASFYGTAEIVESGRGVTDTPGGFNQQAALGLRLRLPGGLDAITTVTHAFVRLTDPKMSNIRKRLTDHILAAKEFLKRLRPPPRQAPQAGIIHSERVANSPLGKEVWLGGTETYVCIILPSVGG